MKNNKSVKNKSNIPVVKNCYYISLENAGKRTQGGLGDAFEGFGRFRTQYKKFNCG